MKLTIQNRTRSKVTVDAVTGNLSANQVKAYTLTSFEVENILPRLLELQAAGVVSFVVEDSTQDIPVIPSATASHWYVSGVNGQDTNDGRSPIRALASLTRLEELLPNEITTTTVVHIGPAGLAGERYVAPSFRARKLSKSLILIGDGALQTGAAGLAYNTLVTATLQAGTTTTSIVGPGGAESWAVNGFVGKTAYITEGGGVAQPRLISANTASVLTPTYPITGAASGATLQIFEPSVVLDIPDVASAGEHTLVRGCGVPSTDASVAVGNSPAFYFINTGLTGTPTGTYGMAIQGSRVVFVGVEYNGATTMQIRVDGSTLLCGLDAADATVGIDLLIEGQQLSISPGLNFSGLGWGFSSVGATSTSSNHSFSGGKIDGFMVSTRGFVFREDNTFYIRGGTCSMPASNARSPLTIRNGARGFLIAQQGALPILISGPSSSGVDIGGISILDNSKVGISGVSISVPIAGTSGIWCARGGNAEVASSPIVGTGGIGGYGLCVGWGGVATIPTSAGWVLTGTLGELSVDNHSGFPAALLTSSGKMARGPGLIERLN